MTPRRDVGQRANARFGQDRGRGRDERFDDGASHVGERSENRTGGREEEEHRPGNQNLFSPLMNEFVAALAAHNRLAQPPRADPSNRALEAAREFRRLNPPKFDGIASDPFTAYHWLEEIRELFSLLAITEETLRVRLAACQFTGEASDWWLSVLAVRKYNRRAMRVSHRVDEPDIEDITWAEFEAKFEDQYLPSSFRRQLREQFGEFSDVAKLARTLGNDGARHGSVRKPGVRLPNPTMSVTPGADDNQNGKRTRDSLRPLYSHAVSKTPSSGFGETHSSSTLLCHRCGQPGHFRAQCPKPKPLPRQRVPDSGVCFGCGEYGHFVKSCPCNSGDHQQRGSQDRSFLRQGTTFREAQWERGTSSSVPLWSASGQAYTVETVAPPPPYTTFRAPDASFERGTYSYFLHFVYVHISFWI